MATKSTKRTKSGTKRSNSKKASGTRSRSRGGAKAKARAEKRQREILAVLLVVLALFVAVALFPVSLVTSAGPDVFPSGNPMGIVGGTAKALLVQALGAGSAGIPLALLLAAAWSGGWLGKERLKQAAVLTLGIAIIAPLVGFLLRSPDAAGWLGTTLGQPTAEAIGWLGAWLVVLAMAGTVSVVAFDVNPLTVAGTFAAFGGRWLMIGWRALADWTHTTSYNMRTAWKEQAARRASERERREAALAAARPAREPFGGAEAGDEAPVIEVDVDETAEPVVPERPTEVTTYDDSAFEALSGVADPVAGAGNHPLPSLDLLTEGERESRLGMERELERLGEVLVEKLRSFNVNCEIGGRTTGPVVTQYEVVPAPGVKVNRIANLDADLALAMRAKSIRIVAPIPGKGAVGVEIPNPKPQVVRLREILEAPAYSRSRAELPLGLGRDLTGDPYVSDLTKMPHALIAGATGSGKSVCLNTVITSLVYRHGPDRLRLLLIDPKMVELSAYADLPHLRHPVVTDPRDAAGVLKWAVMEMERRYALLSENGVRSLQEFNTRALGDVPLRRVTPSGPEGDEDRWIYNDGPLPYIVVVVDELADLMMTVQAEVEKPLTQLAQKARAIGIHLIVATQRPSVNVITGLIKANFPCRIAFRVASKTDSRTILDQNGADSLLGHGDMLFLPPGKSEPVRMQGAFISTEETEALMSWYREQADTLEGLKHRVTNREEDILEKVRELEQEAQSADGFFHADWDDLFKDAAQVCIQQGAGSTSLLQRRLRIGYGRAARIVDQLHDAGVLGPPDGSKPREVLVSLEGLEEIVPS